MPTPAMTTLPDATSESGFISHLIELRNRLLRSVLCVLLLFLVTAVYANRIYAYLAEPLLKHMPKSSSMIAIDVASPISLPTFFKRLVPNTRMTIASTTRRCGILKPIVHPITRRLTGQALGLFVKTGQPETTLKLIQHLLRTQSLIC